MTNAIRSYYVAELYYWREQTGFPYRSAVTVTAIAASQWCNYYLARLIAPLSQKGGPTTKSGLLPENAHERATLVHELVEWTLDNSEIEDLFALFLSDQPLPHVGQAAIFDHHDDTDCWVLNLTTSEFTKLQQVWAEHDLPPDLFYPAEQEICIPYPGNGIGAKLSRMMGAQKCFTPKQWEMYVNRHQ